MSNDSIARCEESWLERSGVPKLFKALSLSIGISTLVPAFVGILLTCLVGYGLDFIWPTTSKPIVVSTAGMPESELRTYITKSGDPDFVPSAYTAEMARLADTKRAGVFSLLLLHARQTANLLTAAALEGDVPAIFSGIMLAIMAIRWLFAMHWVFAVLMGVAFLVIWGVCGGAICRAAALKFARDDAPEMGDVWSYARKRWVRFAVAPILPAATALGAGILLMGMGLVGLIPGLGDLAIGVLFPVAILLGLMAAIVLICGFLIFPLLSPAIATDDIDAGEAIAAGGRFFFERPFKYLLMLVISFFYGAICIVILKLFVATALWLTATFLGATMNWGDAFAEGPTGEATDKLTAMWQAPRPGDGRPFYGEFEGPKLRHVSRWSASLIEVWIKLLWGVVAAFAVAFFHASGTIVYFIMRRDVNETDMEDVYLERADPGTPSPVARGT